MFFFAKIMISALIIAGVTELAKAFPSIGGMIAALPLVSLLSLTWLFVHGADGFELSKFAFGVTKGLPATICMLLVIAISLKIVPFYVSLILGVVGWGLFLFVQRMIGAYFSLS
ncbi:DUF3147 family protein [Cytobacillus spongiae]|uniref:DUF3147 family protein n=1 Tax=Cytobacillus spongiae TaxID=2901381 RepID=UPI001F25334A|nr:DUF3147 family protein [Cytobacillus spongiae]UII54383.1 DUF3147 family protein [Cytobacillus spongiae]